MSTHLCGHPLGFDYDPRSEDLRCFDCGAPCPGPCVCGAPFQSMECKNRGHVGGAQLDEGALLAQPSEGTEGGAT